MNNCDFIGLIFTVDDDRIQRLVLEAWDRLAGGPTWL
jgi:hypothetical protein